MSKLTVDTRALAVAAGLVAELGAKVGAATMSAEPPLRTLAWSSQGAQYGDAAQALGRCMRQALDDLQVALETLADGMTRSAEAYAQVDEAAASTARRSSAGAP